MQIAKHKEAPDLSLFEVIALRRAPPASQQTQHDLRRIDIVEEIYLNLPSGRRLGGKFVDTLTRS